MHCYDTTTHLLMIFLMLWGYLFHVSNAALNVLVLFIQKFLKLIARRKSAPSDNHNTKQQWAMPSH